MSKDKGYCVDAETLLAIKEGNESLIKEFKKDLSQNTTEIKEYLLLHVSPLKDDVLRIRNDVSDLYDKDREMRDRVGVLEQRQSADEGIRSGSSLAVEGKNRKDELLWLKVTGIITGAGAAGALIGYFL